MMPVAVVDLSLPDRDPHRGEPQQRLGLGRRHTVAAVPQVALPQPAITDLLVHPGLAGGSLETTPLLDRTKKPNARGRRRSTKHANHLQKEALLRPIEPRGRYLPPYPRR